MANRYWVGGTASWDATALLKWSLTSGGPGGEAVPTANDDVYFDAASGAVTITLSGARTCLSFNSTDFTGTVAGTGTLAVSGNAIYGSGATFTNTGTWTFNATSGTQQITTNGKTLNFPITQNGVGGTVQLQDNLTMGSTRTFTLTNGALDLNNLTLSTGLFNSNNSNTRSIVFGTGNITLTGNAATIWTTNTSTNFSYTGTPTVNATYAGSTGTRTFNPATAHTEANAINFNITAGTDTVDFTASARRLGSVNFTGFSGTLTNFLVVMYGNLTFSSTMTLTSATGITQFAGNGTQTITSNGQTIPFSLAISSVGNLGTRVFADALTLGAGRTLTMRASIVKFAANTTNTSPSFIFLGTVTDRVILQSTIPGTQYTLSQASGTVDATFTTIQDSNAVGGATWNAYADQFNVDAGNNDGWNFGISPVVGGAEYTYALRSFTQPRRF